MRVLSTPETARRSFKQVVPTVVLSVHGCASLFDFFVDSAVGQQTSGGSQGCFRQTARDLAETRYFSAFLSANAGLFYRRGLVEPLGVLPAPNFTAIHGHFFVPSWCANQWLSGKTPAIAVAYNDGTSVYASWFRGTYNPVSGTVCFDDGTEEVLDRKLDEFVVGEAVDWVASHPDAIFFRAEGIPFLYSNQRADMTHFVEDLRLLVSKMGLCGGGALPHCPGTSVREFVEHPEVNFTVC